MNRVLIVARRIALLALTLALTAPKPAVAQVTSDSATVTGTVTTEGGVPL